MNPSPSAIEAIQTFGAAINGGWQGNTDNQILEAANAPAIANPATQGTVSAPYTYVSLLGVLSPESIAKVVELPSLTAILDSINAGNIVACQRWIMLLVTSGKITGDEAQSIAAVMLATEPDPSWPEQISWAQSNLGRPLDGDDLTDARPQ